MAPKITIVGGGSTHWGPRLLTDFANTPSLHDAEVALVDIDAASLPRMLTIAKHIVTSCDIGMQVTATTELPRALDGADFVVTAFSVGGFESMVHDIEVPARYGVFQPVGDSVGPGGISRSLRSIGVVLDIAREVERSAPEALLLNVSNPLTTLCRAVTSQTNVTPSPSPEPSPPSCLGTARPEIFASPGHSFSLPSSGWKVGPWIANRGSRARSAPLREPVIEPNCRWPSLNSHSMPEMRGDPSARTVAIVLCLPASKSERSSR